MGSETTFGTSGVPLFGSRPPPRIVEPLPDSKMATWTVEPSGLTAMARGSSARRGTSARGAPGASGSKTCTRFGWEQETKARTGLPAKTTSAGSSAVRMVRTTDPDARSTTLMESEIEFTTQASSPPRSRTVTGSRPTGIASDGTGSPLERSRTSRRASEVLQTRSR